MMELDPAQLISTLGSGGVLIWVLYQGQVKITKFIERIAECIAKLEERTRQDSDRLAAIERRLVRLRAKRDSETSGLLEDTEPERRGR